MKIIRATRLFEEWLSSHFALVQPDLARKHSNMASNALTFLRATYYRWAQEWEKRCGKIASAPSVLSVADLHIENFGTWRDLEGRLIWGVNDFDEAFPLPYTSDLVRLATSAALQIRVRKLKIGISEACQSILLGYSKGLTRGPKPFVLEEKHAKLRQLAFSRLRDPKLYWAKMSALPLAASVPSDARTTLEAAMPSPVPFQIFTRQAGEGSLGRPRYTAVGLLNGAAFAREVKAVAPSACLWASDSSDDQLYYQEIIDTAHRCKDPYLRLAGKWIVRRLAADCSRIDIHTLTPMKDQSVLLKAMGRETANIHLGTDGAAAKILEDLRRRSQYWLEEAVQRMVRFTLTDFREWQIHQRRKA